VRRGGVYVAWLLATCGLWVAAASAQNGSEAKPPAHTLRAAAERHHLLMGAAVDSNSVASDAVYASTLQNEYSVLEPDNEMKFNAIHPTPGSYDFAGGDALVAFAQAHNMKVRGHNLLWQDALPPWIASPSTPWTPEALNKVLEDHIATVVGHYRGKVYAWDVVNEPFNEEGAMRSSLWYNLPGFGFSGQGTKMIEQVLRWAHAADPDAKLFVNEYGAEVMNAKSDAMYAMAKDFVRRGVPLTGIGLQLHINPWFDEPNKMRSLAENVKRLGDLGLEVQFTEVDVRLPDSSFANLNGQAAAYKDLLNVCLREPACTLFQTWGFTDRQSWVPTTYTGYGWALPFDDRYRKKPAYRAMLKRLESRGDDGPRPSHAR
jgi:endo-1,4-beta-xylanase